MPPMISIPTEPNTAPITIPLTVPVDNPLLTVLVGGEAASGGGGEMVALMVEGGGGERAVELGEGVVSDGGEAVKEGASAGADIAGEDSGATVRARVLKKKERRFRIAIASSHHMGLLRG